jgi:hypothetical protein
MINRVIFAIRVLVVVLCISATFSGNHPPIHAQVIPPPSEIQMPTQLAVSPYDPEFRSDINAINNHLQSTDARVNSNEATLNSLSRQVSDMDGRANVYFWILGIMVGSSIALPQLVTFKRKKEGTNG